MTHDEAATATATATATRPTTAVPGWMLLFAALGYALWKADAR